MPVLLHQGPRLVSQHDNAPFATEATAAFLKEIGVFRDSYLQVGPYPNGAFRGRQNDMILLLPSGCAEESPP